MSMDTGERQSDLAVMDANEYKQKRRLERILDAHDKVEDKADEAYELYVSGQISADGKNVMLLQAVKQFLRETYNLLDSYDRELDDERNVYWDGREEYPLGRVERDHEPDIIFTGLWDVLHAERFYDEAWTEFVETRHGPNKTVEKSQSHSVPETVSWNAFLRLKQFLNAEHSLEIQFEELDDRLPAWGFEELDEGEVPDDVEVI